MIYLLKKVNYFFSIVLSKKCIFARWFDPSFGLT